jgi:5'-3' exonuclease
MFSLIFI